MSQETFDALWTRAGLEAGAPHDQTIRPPLLTTGPTASLPHLTIGGEAGDAPVPAGPDLVLRGRLGEGGMGVVWLARQGSLDREVAIKQVKREAPRRAVDALLREARFMGGLEHPNIVPVHALGVDGEGVASLVMKRVEGVSWRERIRDADDGWWRDGGAPDALGRHLEILVEVCRAVAYAHGRGVLHRDLKPENVMIGAFGEVYVMDWGVATRLDGADRAGVVGTPAYMAPEMLDPSARLTPATDVYLLGACLHEVLTGRTRHEGRDLEAVLRAAHASAAFDYGDAVPAELAAIANRACAADPSARYPTAGELQRALSWYLRHRASLALAEAAAARVRELVALCDTPAPDAARVEELFTEARFGFRHALDTCADNELAARGLEEGVTAMIAYKLRSGDVGGAGALLAQLPPDAAEPLRARVQAARAQQERAEALARELDPSVGGGARVALVIATLVLFAVISAGVITGFGGDVRAYGHESAVAVMVACTAIVSAVMVAVRRQLLATALNRRLAALVLVTCAGVLGNRLAGWALDTPVSSVLAADLCVIGAIAASTGTLGHPRLGLAALPYFVGLGALATWPDQALPLFATTGLVGLTIVSLLVWRTLR